MSSTDTSTALLTFLFLPWMIVAGSLATQTSSVLMALTWFVMFGLSLWLSLREDAKRDRRMKQFDDANKEKLASLFK